MRQEEVLVPHQPGPVRNHHKMGIAVIFGEWDSEILASVLETGL